MSCLRKARKHYSRDLYVKVKILCMQVYSELFWGFLVIICLFKNLFIVANLKPYIFTLYLYHWSCDCEVKILIYVDLKNLVITRKILGEKISFLDLKSNLWKNQEQNEGYCKNI